MKGNDIFIRNSLLELVLPLETNVAIDVGPLQTLEKILRAHSSDKISIDQWKTLASSSEVNISISVIDLVYKLLSEFYNRSDRLSSSCLVFALFLQNINARRKLTIQAKSKKTLEKVLENFISSNLEQIGQIFIEPERLHKVLELVFCNFTPYIPLDQNLSLLSRDRHSVSSCMKNGKKLVWKLYNSNTSQLAKMATTAHLPSSSGRKRIVLSQLVRQVLAKSSETVTNSSVFIHRSSQSKLYFPTFLRTLDIAKSKHCTIVCGPVKRTLKLTGCRNVTVVAMAKRIIIQDSKDCTLYLHTPTNPLLSSSCQNITFAPYCLNYSQLSNDIEAVSFKPLTVNLWNEPIVVNANQNLSPNHKESTKILEAGKFEKVLFPFSNVILASPVYEIPVRYKEALTFKETRDKEWIKVKEEANFNGEQEQTLMGLIEEDFNHFIDDNAADLENYVESMTDFSLIL